MSLALVLAIGLVLGVRHAADPDHVVAMTTIVARKPGVAAACRMGAMWGIGHTITILVVGGAIALFKVVISARLGLAMEFAVAVMLVALGLVNLTTRAVPTERAFPLRPVAVGLVHGLAGSAAIALLVAATIPDPRWTLAYLLVFGAGTVVGMMAITAALALPLHSAAARFSASGRYLRLASGALSLAFGLFLVHEIGFHDGLFTGAPHWTPK